MFNSKAKAALRAIDEQMTALYQEKRYSQTLAILNDLGRKLINSDRCSFWCVDEKTIRSGQWKHTMWKKS